MRLMTSVLLLSIGLTGCAAMSEKECKRADWDEVGYRDGFAGYEPIKRLASYRDACKKVSVKPDQANYMAAWEQGVAKYCEPGNGFEVGRRGDTYEGVCTGKTASLFRLNYDAGYRIYNLRRQQVEVQKQIDTLETQLASPCDDKSKDAKDCQLSVDERRRINRKIVDLYDQLKVVRRLLAAAEVYSIVRNPK
jgi:hypothetical protein